MYFGARNLLKSGILPPGICSSLIILFFNIRIVSSTSPSPHLCRYPFFFRTYFRLLVGLCEFVIQSYINITLITETHVRLIWLGSVEVLNTKYYTNIKLRLKLSSEINLIDNNTVSIEIKLVFFLWCYIIFFFYSCL